MGRKKYSKELKARIALNAIKVQKTISELASEYGGTCKPDQYMEEAVT